MILKIKTIVEYTLSTKDIISNICETGLYEERSGAVVLKFAGKAYWIKDASGNMVTPWFLNENQNYSFRRVKGTIEFD